MISSPLSRESIATARLLLRPTTVLDARHAFEIQSDWDVARMLARATFPPDRRTIENWFADHEREWSVGEAYRFAVELDGRPIGIVDIDEIAANEGELGYWFERASWRRGFAFEAANALVSFAFGPLGLSRLLSGHAVDNSASAGVLTKLGFLPHGTARIASQSRGHDIAQVRYALARNDWMASQQAIVAVSTDDPSPGS